MDINGRLASVVDRLHHRPRYRSHASIGGRRNGERERKEWGGGCRSGQRMSVYSFFGVFSGFLGVVLQSLMI